MQPTPVAAIVIPEACYRCDTVTRAIVGVLVERADRRPYFVEFGQVADAIAATIPRAALRDLDIGPIKLRRSRLRGTYMSNGCVGCDAILGSFPLRESLLDFLAEGGQLHELIAARWVLPM